MDAQSTVYPTPFDGISIIEMNTLFTPKDPCFVGPNFTTISGQGEQTNRPLLTSCEESNPRTQMENGRTTKIYFQRFLTIESALSRIQLINLCLLVVYVPDILRSLSSISST